MKYIDADRLRAEIERLSAEHSSKYGMDEAAIVLDKLEDFITSLQQEQEEKEAKFVFPKFLYARTTNNKTIDVSYAPQSLNAIEYIRSDSLQQEEPEVDLEKFTEKMDAWKARYNHPDNIPIKATMAFTARMFYMYPNVAREWYDSLPKATMD